MIILKVIILCNYSLAKIVSKKQLTLLSETLITFKVKLISLTKEKI